MRAGGMRYFKKEDEREQEALSLVPSRLAGSRFCLFSVEHACIAGGGYLGSWI
ncbi:hypothetical protein HanPSC8_Chr03g0083871 [Helianthus annuus]|nr:hypothetical protein HanPSC8_Chr03g0083871 [Helianthus annuus]